MDWMKTRRVSAGCSRAGNSAMALRWLAMAALTLAPVTAGGQSGEPGIATETKRSIFSFTRIGQRTKRNGNTQILPGAREIWRRDNNRESRENANYWSIFRSRDEARIGAAARAEMNRNLQAIQARADAYRPFHDNPRGPVDDRKEKTEKEITKFPTPPSPDEPRKPNPSDPSPTPKSETDTHPIESVIKDIENIINPGLTRKPRPASVVLVLLAVILVPSFAGFLLFAGFLNLRHRYWLRGGVFASGGVALLLLIYATAFHREKIPDRQKLVDECREMALTITASVLELDENGDGAILDGLSANGGKTAATDRNGYAFLFTEKLDSISGGKNFTRLVYPVGSIRTYNVWGLGADMPAYTDSLERALDHRKKELLAANWWHRFLQPLVES